MPGIVGDQDHEAAANAGVREREERIGGDVEADVLHGDEHAPPASETPAATSSATFSLGAHSA